MLGIQFYSSLTLSPIVGWQKRHLACKNQCRLFRSWNSLLASAVGPWWNIIPKRRLVKRNLKLKCKLPLNILNSNSLFQREKRAYLRCLLPVKPLITILLKDTQLGRFSCVQNGLRWFWNDFICNVNTILLQYRCKYYHDSNINIVVGIKWRLLRACQCCFR